MSTPEGKVTAAVMKYLAKLKKDGVPIKWLKIHGSPMQRRGEPDLLVVCNGNPVFIELKAPGEKPTPLQVVRLREWEDAGATVGVACSVEEVKDILEPFLETNNEKS